MTWLLRQNMPTASVGTAPGAGGPVGALELADLPHVRHDLDSHGDSAILVVNNAGVFWGRWDCIEVTGPWDTQSTIRTLLAITPGNAKGEANAHAT